METFILCIIHVGLREPRSAIYEIRRAQMTGKSRRADGQSSTLGSLLRAIVSGTS